MAWRIICGRVYWEDWRGDALVCCIAWCDGSGVSSGDVGACAGAFYTERVSSLGIELSDEKHTHPQPDKLPQESPGAGVCVWVCRVG